MLLSTSGFAPVPALIGGLLIGLSASLMLLLHGRVTGISGILATALDPHDESGERKNRLFFLAGLLAGAVPFVALLPGRFEAGIERSLVAVALAGLLVGFGTRLGSGCTSGHGVCGVSRFSPRSMVATATFTAAGALSVLAYRALGGV
jgi:hypothetical protein